LLGNVREEKDHHGNSKPNNIFDRSKKIDAANALSMHDCLRHHDGIIFEFRHYDSPSTEINTVLRFKYI
jgi:hypothetical protein